MARWESDARGRLERAALALFGERGYDGTTVAQIAERAGLTERSFYRYFTDKREVLFAGAEELEAVLAAGIAAAPPDLTPLEVLLTAFARAPEVFRPHDLVVQRVAAIAASPSLRERELIKLASMATALAAGLGDRGVDGRTAQFTADMGISVLRTATEAWVADDRRPFAEHVRDAAEELRRIADQVAFPAP